MSKLNEVFKSLYDLTPQELKQVRTECTRLATKAIKDQLKVGSKVVVVKEGYDNTYVVTKINPKNVQIKKDGTRMIYNCPPSLLEVIE